MIRGYRLLRQRLRGYRLMRRRLHGFQRRRLSWLAAPHHEDRPVTALHVERDEVAVGESALVRLGQ